MAETPAQWCRRMAEEWEAKRDAAASEKEWASAAREAENYRKMLAYELREAE